MFAVTAAAAGAIRSMTEREGLLDKGGLRVSFVPDGTNERALALSLAFAPADGDQIMALMSGANVFLDPRAVGPLTDKLLDVHTDVEGSIKFRLIRQG